VRTAKGYALWLMPSGDSYEILAQTILRLSRQYSTPFFEPHVTLLGGLLEPEEAVLSKTRQLAALVRPFGISLGSLDSQQPKGAPTSRPPYSCQLEGVNENCWKQPTPGSSGGAH